MEFDRKLQELRKAAGFTQEELAKELYVSRAAVSKWESGRGYPTIDSLKEISRFFSVSIDELIGSEEIAAAAEKDKQNFRSTFTALICSLLDLLSSVLLIIPVFGDYSDEGTAVSVLSLQEAQPWLKLIFIILIITMTINGLCGVVISRQDERAVMKYSINTGIALLITSSAVFILTRQPYAGIICFSLLIIKGALLIGKRK